MTILEPDEKREVKKATSWRHPERAAYFLKD